MASQQKTTAPKKQLSKKRFIPLLVLLTVGIILVCWKDSTTYSIRCAMDVIQHEHRKNIIYTVGFLIGVCHFYYVGRSKEVDIGFMKFSTGIFNSIANAFGFALMMNHGLSFSVGLLGDYLDVKPYFVDRNDVDYITLALISFLVVFLAGYMLWKMTQEFLYEITHPSNEAEGVENPADVPKQTTKP